MNIIILGVRIIEDSDNRGSDNRGCTVVGCSPPVILPFCPSSLSAPPPLVPLLPLCPSSLATPPPSVSLFSLSLPSFLGTPPPSSPPCAPSYFQRISPVRMSVFLCRVVSLCLQVRNGGPSRSVAYKSLYEWTPQNSQQLQLTQGQRVSIA